MSANPLLSIEGLTASVDEKTILHNVNLNVAAGETHVLMGPNGASEPMRRVVLNLGLTYDTTPEKMKEALDILKAIPGRVENVSSNPSDTTAVFTNYADSALVIMYIYFIEKQGDILGVTSNMNMEILSSFNKAGLEFAFPTQTVYIQKDEIE